MDRKVFADRVSKISTFRSFRIFACDTSQESFINSSRSIVIHFNHIYTLSTMPEFPEKKKISYVYSVFTVGWDLRDYLIHLMYVFKEQLPRESEAGI